MAKNKKQDYEYNVNERTVIDMKRAREGSRVDVQSVRDFLYHGREEWNTKANIVKILENDPVFDKSQRDFMNRTQRFERGLVLTNRIYELQVKLGWTESETKVALAVLDEQLGIGLHNVAFQPVFTLQASPSLLSTYLPLITNRAILGCYMQTELGHGTNVSSLETTATYIRETGEFEIHSPTLTSAKWWIGGLGRMATHGVVQARLILPDARDMGPHLFFVQLRSLEDHSVLPNIIIGDIGPKALSGFASTDNGFARFNRVRIPREFMLSRFAQVTEDGQYIQPPHAKLSYGGMLYIRATMVTGGGWLTARAATISLRYATVRRQGERGRDGLEKQIITYPSVYYRLLPILSRAYMFIQLGRTLSKAFDTLASRLAQNDTSLLAEMHATTSGLKVYVSSCGVADLETARRTMGGHGYSAFAGVGRLYADYLPSVTYEGDNYVLDQQVVRAALKSYNALMRSKDVKTLSPSSYYLRHLVSAACPASKSESAFNEVSDWSDPERAIHLLELRAAYMVNAHARVVVGASKGGEGKEADVGVDASVNQRISRAVTEAFVARRVGEIIGSLDLGSKDEETREVVKSLFRLYLLTTLESALTDLLSFSLLPIPSSHPPASPSSSPSSYSPSVDPTVPLRLSISCLCLTLLPHAIALTDAFGFTDWELDSALGVRDGKVYEALWERAAREPMNLDLKQGGIGYEASIKPMLERGRKLAEEQIRSEKAKL